MLCYKAVTVRFLLPPGDSSFTNKMTTKMKTASESYLLDTPAKQWTRTFPTPPFPPRRNQGKARGGRAGSPPPCPAAARPSAWPAARPQRQHRPLIWNPHVKKIIHVSKKAKIFLPLILKRIRRESDVRHRRLRGRSVSFLQMVTWDGERSWWRRRGRLQAAGAERGGGRRRTDLGGRRGTERRGGLSARRPGVATTSGSIRASRLVAAGGPRVAPPIRP